MRNPDTQQTESQQIEPQAEPQHGAQELHLRNLLVACSTIVVFGLAFGMSFPLLSLIMESRGISTLTIGINSAMMPIGVLIFSSLIPFFSKRYGGKSTAIVAGVVTGVLFLLYKVFDSVQAWFVLRLLQGMSTAVLYVLSETWIIRFSGSRHRGKVIAIYGSALAASFAAGPIVIGWVGIEGWLPFWIGTAVVAIGTLACCLLKEAPSPQQQEQPEGVFKFAPKAPVLLACVLVFAILDASTFSLLPIYGIQHGFDLPTATLMLTVFVIGNTLLQFPIGWLADNYSHRLILCLCAGITCLMLLLLPFVLFTPLMWWVLVIGGSTGYGVYTVSLAALGSRFEGIELINGSAAFAVVWGVGALFGSVSGGWSMAAFGADGLPYHLSLVYFLLFLSLAMRIYTTNKKSA